MRLIMLSVVFVVLASSPALSACPPSGPFLNSCDFTDLQDAVDSLAKLPSGGTLFIAPGTYDTTTTPRFRPPLRLPWVRPVRIVGAGRSATYLRAASSNRARDLVLLRGDSQSLENLTIQGYPDSTGSSTSRGVVVAHDTTYSAADTTRVIQHALLKDVAINDTNGWGLYVRGDIGSSKDIAIECTYERVTIEGVRDSGAVSVGGGCTTQVFRDCLFNRVRGVGVRIRGQGHRFDSCVFEQNNIGGQDHSQPYLFLDRSSNVVVSQCWFEDNVSGPPAYFVELRNRTNDTRIDGCNFIRGAYKEVRAIYAERWTQALTVVNGDFFSGRADSFTVNNLITVAAAGSGTSVSEAVNLVLLGCVTHTDTDYYKTTVTTETDGTHSQPQPGVIILNQRGLQLPRYPGGPPSNVESTDVGLMGFYAGADTAAGTSSLQIFNGKAWRSIPVWPKVPARKSSVFVQATSMRAMSGSPSMSETGTYPDRYSFATLAATGKTAVGTSWVVPPDYVTGSIVKFTIAWALDGTVEESASNWVCDVNYLDLTTGTSIASTGTNVSSTVSTTGNFTANRLFFTEITSTAAGIAAGRLLRVNVDRDGSNGSDTFTGQIRFVGLLIEYAAAD